VVAEADSSHITAVGRLLASASGGTYAATLGSKINFALDVKYKEPSEQGKRKESLKGHIDISFSSGGKTYRVRSDDVDSLGVTFQTPGGEECDGHVSAACFGLGDLRATAKLLRKKKGKTTIATGLTLRVSLTDRGGPGADDSIGITLWDGNTLLFSSRWDGSETLEQALLHGKVHVR
jgi:hypothetical protein